MVTGGQNLRKDLRRQYGRPAWLDVGKGAGLLLCLVYDISDTGVGMRLATDDTLPAQLRSCSRQLDDPAGVVVSFGRMGTGSAASL